MDFWINLWNIISKSIMGNIVAIIAVLVSLILFILSTKRKGFSYYIESASAVVSVEEKVADQVEVSFGGNKVENVHLIVMNIRNSGNQSIEFDDFEDHVNFDFGWDAQFLRVSVVKTDPPSLNPVFNHMNGRPVLFPLLLNGGDNFTVNFLVSNWDPDAPDALEVRGRIVGVKDIKNESEESGFRKIFALLLLIIVVPTWILVILKIITEIQGLSISIIIYILLKISNWTSRKSIRRYRAYIKNIRSYLDR